MSYTADIADAVVEAINDGGVLPSSVEAVRMYVSTIDYREFTGMICRVIPLAIERSPETRSSVRKDVEIMIQFAVKLIEGVHATEPGSNATLDEYEALVADLADLIALGGAFAGAPVLRVEADPIFNTDALLSHRVYEARLRAFFMYS